MNTTDSTEKYMNNEEKLKSIAEELNDIFKMINKSENQTGGNNNYSRRRNYFIMIGSAISALITWMMFKFYLPMFSISFGFFLSFIMMGFVVLFDEFILPGNTIERISKNALASAISILSFTLIVVFGAQIGNSLISDPIPAEEHHQPAKSINPIEKEE